MRLEESKTATQAKADEEYSIVFFDGVCNLCNGFIDWTMRRDRKKVFRFSPLQGETAKSYQLSPTGDSIQWSIALVDASGTHYESDAAIKIISGVGGLYKTFRVFLIVPKFIRDRVYRLVANNRYRWFGKSLLCRIPTPDERIRFLP